MHSKLTDKLWEVWFSCQRARIVLQAISKPPFALDNPLILKGLKRVLKPALIRLQTDASWMPLNWHRGTYPKGLVRHDKSYIPIAILLSLCMAKVWPGQAFQKGERSSVRLFSPGINTGAANNRLAKASPVFRGSFLTEPTISSMGLGPQLRTLRSSRP